MIQTVNSGQAHPLRVIRWSFRKFRGILFLLYLCAPQVNLLALYFTNVDQLGPSSAAYLTLGFIFLTLPNIDHVTQRRDMP